MTVHYSISTAFSLNCWSIYTEKLIK